MNISGGDLIIYSGVIGMVLVISICLWLDATKRWPFNVRLTHLPSGNLHFIMMLGIFGGMTIGSMIGFVLAVLLKG
ncbi:MAG: hypothetical protein RI911_241 [Candidatus Parcubacteria bacterium]|jgi:hypothetical protein